MVITKYILKSVVPSGALTLTRTQIPQQTSGSKVAWRPDRCKNLRRKTAVFMWKPVYRLPRAWSNNVKNLAKEFGFIIGKRHVGSQPLNKIEESFSNHLLITYQKIGMGFPGTSTFRRICWELRHGDARERFFLLRRKSRTPADSECVELGGPEVPRYAANERWNGAMEAGGMLHRILQDTSY